MRGWAWNGLLIIATALANATGAERLDRGASALRGRELVHQPLNPPFWSLCGYRDAWKQWGSSSKPDDYAQAFRARYGLHEPPYDNGGLPMGFTRSRGLLGLGTGLSSDCLLCHAGRVAGQTIVGLGNSALDMQSLYEDLAAADGLDPVMPLPLCNVRGTSEASNFAIYLMQLRDTELHNRLPRKYSLCPNLCEDIPAWWHFRRKRTIYHLGVADTRSVRTLMPFLLIPGNSAAAIKAREPDFADIRAYLLSLEPPRYPFATDRQLAAAGRVVFDRSCCRCHGTYGPRGRYPNKLVPLDVIGTDPTLAHAFAPEGVAHYLASWFARSTGRPGNPTTAWAEAATRRRRSTASGPRLPTCTTDLCQQSIMFSSQVTARAFSAGAFSGTSRSTTRATSA